MTDDLELEPDYEDDGTPINFGDDGKAIICPCCRHHVRAYDFNHRLVMCAHHVTLLPEPIRHALCHQPGDAEKVKWATMIGASESFYFYRGHYDANGWLELIERSNLRGETHKEHSRWIAISQIRSCGYGR